MVHRIKLVLFGLITCLMIPSGAQAVEYQIRYLSPLMGDVSSYLNDMNSNGWAVGTSEAEDDRTTPVLWAPNGDVTPLVNISAWCINNTGQIAGLSQETGYVVVRDMDGSIRTLGQGFAERMNDSGQIAGFADIPMSDGTPKCRAAIWEPDGTLNVVDQRLGIANSYLLDINDNGVAVGKWYYRSDYVEHGFMWSKTTGFVDLGKYGKSYFLPNSISNDGRIMGTTVAGYLPTLRNPDGSFVQISDVSYGGATLTRAGEMIINDGQRSVIVYPDNSQQLLPGIGSWPEYGALAITSSGMIGGQCFNQRADRALAIVWEPVPEPSSISIFACGLGCSSVILLRRRRPSLNSNIE